MAVSFCATSAFAVSLADVSGKLAQSDFDPAANAAKSQVIEKITQKAVVEITKRISDSYNLSASDFDKLSRLSMSEFGKLNRYAKTDAKKVKAYQSFFSLLSKSLSEQSYQLERTAKTVTGVGGFLKKHTGLVLNTAFAFLTQKEINDELDHYRKIYPDLDFSGPTYLETLISEITSGITFGLFEVTQLNYDLNDRIPTDSDRVVGWMHSMEIHDSHFNGDYPAEWFEKYPDSEARLRGLPLGTLQGPAGFLQYLSILNKSLYGNILTPLKDQPKTPEAITVGCVVLQDAKAKGKTASIETRISKAVDKTSISLADGTKLGTTSVANDKTRWVTESLDYGKIHANSTSFPGSSDFFVKLNISVTTSGSNKIYECLANIPPPPISAFSVALSVSPLEITAGNAVALSASTSTEVGSVFLTVMKDGKKETVIDLVSPNQKEWMAGLQNFEQPGSRIITATAKDKSGAVLGTSQPVTVAVKPAEAKAPTAVVTAVTATTDNIKLNDSVGFVANVSGTLAEGDQVKLVLDNWSTVMPKVGNRWGNTVGIDEAVNGKRMYSAHVVGKNGLSSASTQPKQITVLSPITIKSVVVKKDKQNVEINNCVLGDNVDFFVTTTGATKGTSELFLVMDGKDYVMKSVDGQIWTFKAWIGEAPGGKRNYTAYARHKGTLSARPGLKSLFVAPRTRVTSIDAFMNDRPTSTFSSGTPIKFVVKLDGQTDGKVVVMIDQFKMEIAKPDANGNWTASAPIWDKDGKTRTFWAYVEEGYLQGISSAKKTLTSNSAQPNSVDCGNQHVKVNDEIHLKVTTGNGGYNLVGTLAGAGGGLDMRFHALNDVVWEWAHKVKETRKGVLTATIKVEDKPEGGKVIDTFTCTYAFNGATLPTTPPVPTTPAKVTSVTYSPNPASPDFPFTVTVHTDISPAVPPIIINHNPPLHMQSDGTESTIKLDLAKDFGIPANSTTGEISLVVLLHDGLGGSTNTTVKIPYARSNNQQVVKDLYDRFKAGYSSRNMAALQGLISDDWQSESDGTTLSDLEDNLRRSFKIYNQISYTISNLQIAAMSDAKRFRVSYDVRIVGTVYQPNLRHDEQSSVTEEVVVDQGGKAKIAKTLNGRFWSVK